MTFPYLYENNIMGKSEVSEGMAGTDKFILDCFKAIIIKYKRTG